MHLTGLDDVNSFYTEAEHAALRQPFAGCRITAMYSPEVADLAPQRHAWLYIQRRWSYGYPAALQLLAGIALITLRQPLKDLD